MKSDVITFQDEDITMILKDFPKSLKKFEGFMDDLFAKGTPQGEPVETKELIPSILFFAPRTLFDFFDENRIFISIDYMSDGLWDSEVNGIFGADVSNRIEAEKQGFLEAFKQLEAI